MQQWKGSHEEKEKKSIPSWPLSFLYIASQQLNHTSGNNSWGNYGCAYKHFAILGRGKTEKQAGPTHLLKRNKLWCHPAGHKSYLKVYLLDWISVLRGHTVHNHVKTVSHLVWEPDMNKIKNVIDWIVILPFILVPELLQLCFNYSLDYHLPHPQWSHLTQVASSHLLTLLTKFTVSLLHSMQPHLHSPRCCGSPHTPWAHHKLTLPTYNALYLHCSSWSDSLWAHCSYPAYNAYYCSLIHLAKIANHELTSLSYHEFNSLTMLSTNSPYSLQAQHKLISFGMSRLHSPSAHCVLSPIITSS